MNLGRPRQSLHGRGIQVGECQSCYEASCPTRINNESFDFVFELLTRQLSLVGMRCFTISRNLEPVVRLFKTWRISR